MKLPLPQRTALLALGTALALHSPAAHAGRPLSTDDAGVADPGSCYAEGWHERQGGERAWVIAPACGVVPGVEIGADFASLHPGDPVRAVGGIAFKWAPQAWQTTTAAGALSFAAKLGGSFSRETGRSWGRSETNALLLATLAPSDEVSITANLGAARDRSSSTTAGLLNLALSWAPIEAALLFAETQANSKSTVFGGTVNSVGGRWWLVDKRFGLDLTASREVGVGATLWTFGFGWYDLSF